MAVANELITITTKANSNQTITHLKTSNLMYYVPNIQKKRRAAPTREKKEHKKRELAIMATQ